VNRLETKMNGALMVLYGVYATMRSALREPAFRPGGRSWRAERIRLFEAGLQSELRPALAAYAAGARRRCSFHKAA